MSQERARFIELIDGLVGRFEHDVNGAEWVLKRYPKRIRDEDRTVFEVPALYLQKGPVRLLLDPVGYDVPGAEATADLYQMPTYDPLATLYCEAGSWWVHSDFLPGPENEAPAPEGRRAAYTAEAINRVLDEIAEHAVS